MVVASNHISPASPATAAYASRPCPACQGSEGASTRAITSRRPAEALEFEALRAGWEHLFKERAFFSYHRCACGMLFCPTFFSPPQLEALYGQMSDNTYGVPMAALRATQHGYLKTLSRYGDLSGDYLELGPDIGLFTEHCARAGKFGAFWLFEPNLNVHGQLQSALAGRDVRLQREMVNLDAVPDDTLSLAVMIHVLDHLFTPRDMLRQLAKKLRLGGKLLVVTHDESSALAQALGWRWPAYCLQHPHLFRGATMRSMLAREGLSVVAVHKTANHFPVSHLVRHLGFALGLGPLSFVPELSSFRVPLKLGNIITIATRDAPGGIHAE